MSFMLEKLKSFSIVSEIQKMTQPSLYEEVTIMLSGALTIYLVADLRDLARSGKATVSLQELEPPTSIDKVLGILKDNKKLLEDSGAYPDIEERLTALENLRLHNSNALLNALIGQSEKARVVEFVDVNAKTELVHSIVINDTLKRITVIFRGSVTTKDFITDAKVGQIKVTNPAYKLDKNTSNEEFRLHYGFYEYLFEHKCPIHKGKTRYEGILLSLKDLLKQNPGYKVYCTGHSLGGALCTIFGMYAAADDEIMKLCTGPIKVISVASPYVGNWKFLIAFQSLERLGRVRHLRIANAEDLVSLMPFAAHKHRIKPDDWKHGIADVYRHCGIKLHLNDLAKKDCEQLYKFNYPLCQVSDESIADEIKLIFEDGKNFFASVGLILKKSQQTEVLRYHSCEEYELRLNAIKDTLQRVTLEDLYNDKNIVGDTMEPGYVPKMLSAGEAIQRLKESTFLQSTIKAIISN